MPSFMRKQTVRYRIFLLMLVSAVTVGALAYHNVEVAIASLLLFVILFVLVLRTESHFRRDTEKYLSSFSERFIQTSEAAINELPIGVLLYNEAEEIEWSNQYLREKFEEKVSVGSKLSQLCEQLTPMLEKKSELEPIEMNGSLYQIQHNKKNKLIYFTDITEQSQLKQAFADGKTVISIIFIDNYDDVTQGMDDQKRSSINSFVTSELNQWARDYGIYLRRVSSDRFIGVFHQKTLTELEASKFSVLDDVREGTHKEGTPLTLSIGVASGVDDLLELGSLAQSGLDLALGRGGDQAVVKAADGKAKFYGGKTNPSGKRTRVRARVISHALKDLIVDSQNVVIMGHRYPDMDVLGSAMGLLRIVETNERKGYIVLNQNEIDSSVANLLDDVLKNASLAEKIISVEQSLELTTEGTLLIVVDTHRPEMVIEEKLLKKAGRVVVIDHHRRAEHSIENPILSYMEPYASSAAELVTELLEYHPNRKKIEIIEATALLAGIMVDTKSFTLRTGARTFDAASFLRLHGADIKWIQTIMKEDIESFVERNKLIEQVYFYKPGIAITKGDDKKTIEPVLIAKAADALLSMEDVLASFVIARRTEDSVSISSRSLGDINVQLIMEKLDGGGHLSNAGAQIKGLTIDEAEMALQRAIDEQLEGSMKE